MPTVQEGRTSEVKATRSGTDRFRSLVLMSLLVLAVVGPLILAVAAFGRANDRGSATIDMVWALIPVVFAICGALIVRKQPRNGVGWVLIAPGLALMLTAGGLSGMTSPPATVGFFTWIFLWAESISWMLLFFPVFYLFLVYPTGRLLSPRWRIVVVIQVLMFCGLAGLIAVADRFGPLGSGWTVANPIGFVDNTLFEEGGAFTSVWTVLLIVLVVAGVTALVLRFRRGSPIERGQIKWLMLAVGFFGLVYSSLALSVARAEESWLVDLLLVTSLMGIPVAILIAVTRYRLFEIDRLVSRTVSYALVAGVIVLFVGVVATVVGTRFDSPIVVSATTLAVAAMFNPLRTRVQTWVDRRFNRSPHDIAEVIAVFTASLRDGMDTSEMVGGMVEVVSGAMQPATVAVWVRD